MMNHAGIRGCRSECSARKSLIWLMPTLLLLLVFGLLIIFARSSAIAPFLYNLF
jgi:Family of unknown function (DUF5989)